MNNLFKKIKQKNTVEKDLKKKKISFISTIFIVIGSCIGAGIFFKSQSILNNSSGSLVLAIFSWVLAAFTVIAMSFALIEVASSGVNSNLSIVAWNKSFNSNFIYKTSKNFIVFIYLPLTMFVMPIYFFQSLQDSYQMFSGAQTANLTDNLDWLIAIAVTVFLTFYFLVFSGLFAKIGNLQNKIIFIFKFIPLVLAILMGYILLSSGAQSSAQVNVNFTNIKEFVAQGNLLSNLPGLGIFVALSAIFFAYDGFYVSAGIQSEVEKPKKTPFAILIGLIVITVIYLLIAISMSIVGDGTVTGFLDVAISIGWNVEVIRIILGITNVLIAIGVLGILNGFSMWFPRVMEDLVKNDEFYFNDYWKKKMKSDKPIVGVILALLLSVPIIIVFSIIGTFAYHSNGLEVYGQNISKLYSFTDLMSSWTSVIVFLFIVFAIYGALKNRKTQHIKVEQFKYFKLFAYISIILVGISMLVTVVVAFFDLSLIPAIARENLTNEILTSRIASVIVLILFIVISIAPIYIEKRFKKNTTHVIN
ncbi:hypothetical protein CJJ23_02910 [Mycoplasmopsis agassizii]|uniref:Amino acid permease n=1 Tax=Mycoplasmopsis agassizii TaxID=33922 RepID=A0A269TIG0_9BACT|nr:APC family permease [Mycoplasmopsis agassizii]PAK21273.1 hypothetical protein CJJ23_02910 [Mycoplasmopsis agassizii]